MKRDCCCIICSNLHFLGVSRDMMVQDALRDALRTNVCMSHRRDNVYVSLYVFPVGKLPLCMQQWNDADAVHPMITSRTNECCILRCSELYCGSDWIHDTDDALPTLSDHNTCWDHVMLIATTRSAICSRHTAHPDISQLWMSYEVTASNG